MGIAKNRKVSLNDGKYIQIQNLEIPNEGLIVHLKQFGRVKVFQRKFKNENHRYYIIYLPDEDALIAIKGQNLKLYIQSIGALSDLW